MLKTVYREIIDKNTFLIHFVDKGKDIITSDQSDTIYKYQTMDDSEFRMGLRINAQSKSVLIDVKIKYPLNFYNPNFHELIDGAEKRFQDFYNEIMNNHQTMDYNGLMVSKHDEIEVLNP